MKLTYVSLVQKLDDTAGVVDVENISHMQQCHVCTLQTMHWVQFGVRAQRQAHDVVRAQPQGYISSLKTTALCPRLVPLIYISVGEVWFQTQFEPNRNWVSGFRFGKFLPKPNGLVSGFGLLKFLKQFQIWFKPQTVCTYNFFYSYCKLFRSVFNTYIYIYYINFEVYLLIL